jgi:hypothetical protein
VASLCTNALAPAHIAIRLQTTGVITLVLIVVLITFRVAGWRAAKAFRPLMAWRSHRPP